ncbi:type II toxin-antitoxin system RelE/ParE family toxin [Massilia solisilvae]|uniref:type II toxin-antitoxin system RelE/ParE family toxin n=1 Tax=Massilia solisilvae TaxID=1811225 RepID=UPI00351CEEA2
MRVIWSPEAKGDRRAIFQFIAANNHSAAIAFDHEIARAATLVSTFPHIGRAGRMAGTHEHVVARHYLLIYTLSGGAIRIVRVLHTSQQWP